MTMRSVATMAFGLGLLIGCNGAVPPAPRCEPVRVMLDGAPLKFEHGTFGYRHKGTWTISMFSSAEQFGPGDPTCANALGSSSAARIQIIAFDGKPRMGAVARDLHVPSSIGLTTHMPVPGTRCGDARCSRIEAEVVATPAAMGADVAMCVSANVYFTDNDGIAHELTIDGRVVGTYCGVKP